MTQRFTVKRPSQRPYMSGKCYFVQRNIINEILGYMTVVRPRLHLYMDPFSENFREILEFNDAVIRMIKGCKEMLKHRVLQYVETANSLT